jgi:hypothetical protein
MLAMAVRGRSDAGASYRCRRAECKRHGNRGKALYAGKRDDSGCLIENDGKQRKSAAGFASAKRLAWLRGIP